MDVEHRLIQQACSDHGDGAHRPQPDGLIERVPRETQTARGIDGLEADIIGQLRDHAHDRDSPYAQTGKFEERHHEREVDDADAEEHQGGDAKFVRGDVDIDDHSDDAGDDKGKQRQEGQ